MVLFFDIESKTAYRARRPDDKWIIDSGCSRHMTGVKELFWEYKPISNSRSIMFGNNMTDKITGVGLITNGYLTIKNVAYVERLKHNLVSVSQLGDTCFGVEFDDKVSHIKDKSRDNMVVITSNQSRSLYPMDITTIDGQ